jgi:hypothetical protein
MNERRIFLGRIAFLAALSAPGLSCFVRSAAGAESDPDPWAPVRQFVGDWSGTASGMAGNGTVQRSYAFVLNNRFLRESNTSTYPPQEKNPRGGRVC